MASVDMVARSRARVGTMLKDKWHLDGLLGVGGSAAVYAATHRNKTRAAIKLLHPELGSETEFIKRFLREGYVANTIRHPGAVAILDDDKTEEGLVFIVMELLSGYTLERRLRKEPILPTQDALKIGEDILDILAAAHEKGIVHRDIKPANIFVTQEKVIKLLDFGIARIRESSEPASAATQQGLALGTPAFMSPEQARGRWNEVDARSDLYAVGATLWTALVGQRTRKAATSNEELLLAMTEPIPSVETVAPHVGSEIAKVIDRAVAFDRSERWPNARTMQQALRLAALLERPSNPHEDPNAVLSDVGSLTPSHEIPFGLARRSTPPSASPFSSGAVEGAFSGTGGEETRSSRLSDSRFDALGARPVRPRPTPPPPAVEVALPAIREVHDSVATRDVETNDVVDEPDFTTDEVRAFRPKRHLGRWALAIFVVAIAFLGAFYAGALDDVAWLRKYTAMLPSREELLKLFRSR